MTVAEWTLVSPIGRRADENTEIVVGARREGGRRLGMLWNRKPNAEVIGEELLRLADEAGLVERVGVYEKVEGPGMGASSELLDRIAAECDLVVVGTAD